MPFLEDDRFNYGKYAGRTLGEVRDEAFIRWVWASREELALSSEEEKLFTDLVNLIDIGQYEEYVNTWEATSEFVPEPEVETEIVKEPREEPDRVATQIQILEPCAMVPPLPPGVPLVRITVPPLPPGVQPVSTALILQPEVVQGYVDEEPPFEPPAPAPEIEYTEEQEAALEEIDEWWELGNNFFALTGPAGTGKSTLMREIARRHFSMTLTAMTGKAALRLGQLAGNASTLHSKMYYPPNPGEAMRFVRLREPPSAGIVVDETSMMGPAVFKDLCGWGPRALLVGDPFQLPAVITGKELQEYGEDWSVFSKVRSAKLITVMRNAGGILRAATRVRESGEICRESIPDDEGGYFFVRTNEALQRAVEDYCADMEDHFLITWKNATRMAANRMVRKLLGREGPLPDDGEPVLIKKNGEGFLNGEIVICRGFETGPQIGSLRTLWMSIDQGIFPPKKLLVSADGGSPSKGGEFFDGGMPWIEDWKKYHIDLRKGFLPEPAPISWGYCVTCHAAQGSEARRVTVFLERSDERNQNFRKLTTLPDGTQAPFAARWAYTALTRGKKSATMIVGR